MHIPRERPDTRRGPAENFTGTVWLDGIAAPAAPSRLRVFSVHFPPGAHTAWHRHPHGQVLPVLAGEGLVQRGAASRRRSARATRCGSSRANGTGTAPGHAPS
ncbi:hypothetical protein SAMN05216533_0856 [Streptomyces sp. Ag109_O5-10]|nr:hypothetical protein SAMN05216533_0856 [Streptomyces sp. Ag109_O5-10]